MEIFIRLHKAICVLYQKKYIAREMRERLYEAWLIQSISKDTRKAWTDATIPYRQRSLVEEEEHGCNRGGDFLVSILSTGLNRNLERGYFDVFSD